VYLAAIRHLKLDMLLAHVVYQPVLETEALVTDPENIPVQFFIFFLKYQCY
jgi:hypothetical protein